MVCFARTPRLTAAVYPILSFFIDVPDSLVCTVCGCLYTHYITVRVNVGVGGHYSLWVAERSELKLNFMLGSEIAKAFKESIIYDRTAERSWA